MMMKRKGREMSDKKYTAQRAKFRFGQPMNPCPKCGGYNLGTKVPIRIDHDENDDARALLRKWAKAHREGPVLKGIAYIVCQDCFHQGPHFDCSHMSYDEVMKSHDVAKEVKRLWNSQESKDALGDR